MAAAPNVLLVVVDDHGLHQLGCYGSECYHTPRIDALAGEGMRFTRSYSTAPVCSPARASLYTGRHPARLRLTNYIPGTEPANSRLLTPRWRPYLRLEEETLGAVFKTAGYATGHFGKWHLAVDYMYQPGRPTDPESHGFEEVFVTRKPPAEADPGADPHHTMGIAHRAADFMTACRDRPFFCVVAYNALHRPELAPSQAIARWAARPGAEEDFNRPTVVAMMEEVDRSAGVLLDNLRGSKRERDTIVVFTSDHGAFDRSMDRKPLRGAKADLYEAGIRVPLIVRWPGRVPAGSVSNLLVQNSDLFPTLCSLAGVKPASLVERDGFDLRDVLLNGSRELASRDLYWHFPHYHHLGPGPCGAIRSGRYKLIEWFEGSLGVDANKPPFELFDLESDPGEYNNRAEIEPAACARLAGNLQTWRRQIGAQEMPVNPGFDPSLGPTPPPPPTGDPVNPYGE
ncbi:MAG: sulfatase [Opitutaceae bacterium]